MAMTKEEREQNKERLAGEILDYVRDDLVVKMPFFNRALLKMPVVFYEDFELEEGEIPKGIGTDGHQIYCNKDVVLRLFRQEKGRLQRIWLHQVLHCLFRHPFEYEKLESKYWDFAADLAVEQTILEMGMKEVLLPDDKSRRQILAQIKTKAGRLTAENLYHYFFLNPEEAERLMDQAFLFKQDLHGFWILDSLQQVRKRFPKNPHPGMNKISQEWKELGISVQLDVQVFEKNRGMAPGSMSENLEGVTKDRYNYEEFLKKFAITSEEMQINQEEFDYIYYTYGMDLYGNMPLVEPLEYRDEKKIHDFVIAIDTSGSCQGATVQAFLDKTYSILMSTKSFFHDVNIHIIQCDSKIQQDVKITCPEEFEEFRDNIEIKGFGGTDFRPVFAHVEELIKNRELTDLKGLIYFTDGMGIFPEKMPPYKTAFVFVKEGFGIPEIPSWAIKLVLKDEDLQETIIV